MGKLLGTLASRFKQMFPHFFAYRFDVIAACKADECLEIIKAETTPTEKAGMTWGFKPVIASFKPTYIELKQRDYYGSNDHPTLYAYIKQTDHGIIMQCLIAYNGVKNATSALLMAICIIFPPIIITSLIQYPRKTSDFITGMVIALLFPIGSWSMTWMSRKNYERAIEFHSDFLKTRLAAYSPHVLTSTLSEMPRSSPLLRARIGFLKGSVILAFSMGLGYTFIVFGTDALAAVLALLSPTASALFSIAIFVGVIIISRLILFSKDPGFPWRLPGSRSKSNTLNSRQDTGQ